jgi:hypothetical protein
MSHRNQPEDNEGVFKKACLSTSLAVFFNMGVLNNNNFQGHIDPQTRCISAASGRFKKACPEPVEGFVQSFPELCRREGRSIACGIPWGATVVCARNALPVREHGKLVRTPLAVFFSTPSCEICGGNC